MSTSSRIEEKICNNSVSSGENDHVKRVWRSVIWRYLRWLEHNMNLSKFSVYK